MLIQFVEGIAYLLFRLVFVKQFVCRFFVNYIWCFKFIIRVIFAVAENEYKCRQEATIGTWKAFEELYKAGRIRAIGVSNFMPHHIELLKAHCEILPMVNQLRLCPGVTQPEVVEYCKKNNILVEAYSPFGTGAIFKVPQMQQLAQKYGRSVGQICLRWSMQMGWLPLPKSANPDRVKENLNVFDFELEPEDVDLIANLKGVCGEAPVPDEIHF